VTSIEVSRRGEVARRVAEIAFQVHAAAYVFTVALVTVIWVAAGAHGGFWPMWVAFPWCMALGVHAWLTWALPTQLRRH
jgi:hypothetical protein